MLKDQINTKLEEGSTNINAKGMLYEINPQNQIWGEIALTSLSGNPISVTTKTNHEIDIRMCFFASGSLVTKADGSYPVLYQVDNCHEDRVLHEHDKNKRNGIKAKDIGDLLRKTFVKLKKFITF
jgi:hypothetical protein